MTLIDPSVNVALMKIHVKVEHEKLVTVSSLNRAWFRCNISYTHLLLLLSIHGITLSFRVLQS